MAARAPDLAVAEDAREEALAVALEHAGDAVDLGQVEAEQQPVRHQSPFRPKKRAIVAAQRLGLLGRLPVASLDAAPGPCGAGARG